MTNLIDISRQCCDADEYLDMGYWCAQGSSCYHNLRPIGNTFWFSIPYRLHTSVDILFYLQAGLYLLVIAAFAVLIRRFPRAGALSLAWQIVTTVIFASVLLLVIYPTIYVTLSDTPATLIFMLAIVLSLLASQRDSAILYILSGFGFGIACLFRTAYLLPLLSASLCMMVISVMAHFFWKLRFSRKSLWMFVLFAPVLLQTGWTWSRHSEFSFVSRAQTKGLFEFQLGHPAAGYDTVLPQNAYIWESRCHNADGILPLLQQHHYLTGLCLVAERLYFYLGSDARHNFAITDQRDYLDYLYAEFAHPGKGLIWRGMELASETDTSPLGDMSARRFIVDEAAPVVYLRMNSLLPLPPGNYHFSIWLWAPTHKPGSTIVVDSTLRWLANGVTAERPLANTSIRLAQEPQQVHLDFSVDDAAYAVITIHPASTSRPAVEYFHAWGPMLESSADARGYLRPHFPGESALADTTTGAITGRHFSVILFAANLLALALMVACLAQLWKQHHWPAVPYLLLAVLALLLQSLLIVPEQRFMQPILAASWMFSVLYWVAARHPHYDHTQKILP